MRVDLFKQALMIVMLTAVPTVFASAQKTAQMSSQKSATGQQAQSAAAQQPASGTKQAGNGVDESKPSNEANDSEEQGDDDDASAAAEASMPAEPDQTPEKPAEQVSQKPEDEDSSSGDSSNGDAIEDDEAIYAKYSHIDPNKVVPELPLKRAIKYFHKYKSEFSNTNYLVIADFTKHASERRLYVIDMKSGEVERLLTSHGKGSDPKNSGYARKFSNQASSKATSVGFYKTAETYVGKHGRSLRLDGLSSTNNRARQRAIVIHGAKYVKEKQGVAGRSFGCITVDNAKRNKIIDRVKGGALVYAWGGQKPK